MKNKRQHCSTLGTMKDPPQGLELFCSAPMVMLSSAAPTVMLSPCRQHLESLVDVDVFGISELQHVSLFNAACRPALLRGAGWWCPWHCHGAARLMISTRTLS